MLSYSVLRYKNMQEFDDSIDGWDGSAYGQGSPQFFTMFENQAILFPVPNVSVTNGLKVLYNRKPVDVVGLSDNLDLPLLYHNTILKFCLWQASLLDQATEPAVMYRNDFQDDMVTLINNETQDPVATYPVITVLDFDQ